MEKTNVVNHPTAAATPAPTGRKGQDKKLLPPRRRERDYKAQMADRLKSERVQEELKSMPGWRLVPGGQAIDRVRELPSPGVAAAYARYVAECVQQANVPVTLVLSDNLVTVTLRTSHRRSRLSLPDAALQVARVIG